MRRSILPTLLLCLVTCGGEIAENADTVGTRQSAFLATPGRAFGLRNTCAAYHAALPTDTITPGTPVNSGQPSPEPSGSGECVETGHAGWLRNVVFVDVDNPRLYMQPPLTIVNPNTDFQEAQHVVRQGADWEYDFGDFPVILSSRDVAPTSFVVTSATSGRTTSVGGSIAEALHDG